MKRKDLTGNKYGHLNVVEMLYGYNGGRRTFCRCVCDCGNEKIIDAGHLQRRKNQSCGCMASYYASLRGRTNEIGKTYGYLTIVDIDYSTHLSRAKCVCKCGNIVYKIKADVVHGHTRSCGCLWKETISKANTKDYSGYVSASGVVIKSKNKKVNGVWHYNCICPLCGETFIALPIKVINGNNTSCGCSVSSSGERIIVSILNELNLKYERQKRFNDCKYKYTLPFDFAVYDNNKLKCLIEYDGKQHFEAIDYFGGEDAYRKTVIRDNIKNNYCKENNILLIRFKYSDSVEYIKETITNIFYP